MRALRTALRTATVLAVAAPVSVLVHASAHAGQSTDELQCGGQTVTVRANGSNSSDQGGWSSVQVLSGGSGHLTPLSFSGVATDLTIDQVIYEFEAAKGNGRPASSGSTTCTAVYTGTLADFLDEGDELPEGAALTDEFEFAFTAVVVQRGR